jgi:hypothetical protein
MSNKHQESLSINTGTNTGQDKGIYAWKLRPSESLIYRALTLDHASATDGLVESVY